MSTVISRTFILVHLRTFLQVARWEAVEAVGPENFDSRALYEAAQSFPVDVNDYGYSFGPNERVAVDYLGIYELRASEEDLFRVVEEWQLLVPAP